MKKSDFRKILKEYEQSIEAHQDDFKVICNWIEINNSIVIYSASHVRLVGENFWIDRVCIALKDVHTLNINKVEECKK